MFMEELSKEELFAVLEMFMVNDTINPGKFKQMSSKYKTAIDNFHYQTKKDLKFLGFEDDSYADFIYHGYLVNLDNIEDGTLTLENTEVPELNTYKLGTVCFLDIRKSEMHSFENQKLYSTASLYWAYDYGNFDPAGGKMVNEDFEQYEINDWYVEFMVEKNESLKESKKDDLKRLYKLREIIDNKIKSLL
jgi:hypothetical protein